MPQGVCKGLKKDGQRCTRKVPTGTQFCSTHAGQAPAPAPAAAAAPATESPPPAQRAVRARQRRRDPDLGQDAQPHPRGSDDNSPASSGSSPPPAAPAPQAWARPSAKPFRPPRAPSAAPAPHGPAYNPGGYDIAAAPWSAPAAQAYGHTRTRRDFVETEVQRILSLPNEAGPDPFLTHLIEFFARAYNARVIPGQPWDTCVLTVADAAGRMLEHAPDAVYARMQPHALADEARAEWQRTAHQYIPTAFPGSAPAHFASGTAPTHFAGGAALAPAPAYSRVPAVGVPAGDSAPWSTAAALRRYEQPPPAPATMRSSGEPLLPAPGPSSDFTTANRLLNAATPKIKPRTYASFDALALDWIQQARAADHGRLAGTRADNYLQALHYLIILHMRHGFDIAQRVAARALEEAVDCGYLPVAALRHATEAGPEAYIGVSATKATGRSTGPRRAWQPSTSGGATGKLWCKIHGWCKHASADCRDATAGRESPPDARAAAAPPARRR